MSGFDNAKVDAAFFAGTPLKSNFIARSARGRPSYCFRAIPVDLRRGCRSSKGLAEYSPTAILTSGTRGRYAIGRLELGLANVALGVGSR